MTAARGRAPRPRPGHDREYVSRESNKMNLPHTPSFRLDGKRALVTGGTRGIGLGAAVALAEAGAAVTIAARTAGDIETVVNRMPDAGNSFLKFKKPSNRCL